jgi:hypothetical protein
MQLEERLAKPAGEGDRPLPTALRGLEISAPRARAIDAEVQLQARARDRVRSVSSYIARLIVEDLGRG